MLLLDDTVAIQRLGVGRDGEGVLRRLFAGTAHVEEITVEERALETAFLDLVKENN